MSFRKKIIFKDQNFFLADIIATRLEIYSVSVLEYAHSETYRALLLLDCLLDLHQIFTGIYKYLVLIEKPRGILKRAYDVGIFWLTRSRSNALYQCCHILFSQYKFLNLNYQSFANDDVWGLLLDILQEVGVITDPSKSQLEALLRINGLASCKDTFQELLSGAERWRSQCQEFSPDNVLSVFETGDLLGVFFLLEGEIYHDFLLGIADDFRFTPSRDYEGSYRLPLHLAAKCRRANIFELFIDRWIGHKSEFDLPALLQLRGQFNEIFLHHAFSEDQEKILEILITRFLENRLAFNPFDLLEIADSHCEIPLHYAARCFRKSVFNLLIKEWENNRSAFDFCALMQRKNLHGETPFDLLEAQYADRCYERLLLAKHIRKLFNLYFPGIVEGSGGCKQMSSNPNEEEGDDDDYSNDQSPSTGTSSVITVTDPAGSHKANEGHKSSQSQGENLKTQTLADWTTLDPSLDLLKDSFPATHFFSGLRSHS